MPSSLTVSLSSALVFSHPTTCVGLRYGPVRGHTSHGGFLGSLLHVSLSLSPGGSCTFGARLGRCRRPSKATSLQRAIRSARGDLASPSPRGLTRPGLRNIDRMSIRLTHTAGGRARLTLNRLALFRNPWSCGDGVSRPVCRYLCLHLLFRLLQQSSRVAFAGAGMLPYRYTLKIYPASSAPDLCPIIIHADPLD